MNEKKYTEDGYLIVPESHTCSLWEKGALPCTMGWNSDCFFCKYSDFRKPEYISRVENEAKISQLYSVCHNELNRQNAVVMMEIDDQDLDMVAGGRGQDTPPEDENKRK